MQTKARKNKYRMALKALRNDNLRVHVAAGAGLDAEEIKATLDRALRKALYMSPKVETVAPAC